MTKDLGIRSNVHSFEEVRQAIQRIVLSLNTAEQNDLSASSTPGTTDDKSAGYSVGSFIYDTSTHRLHRCTDATKDAATWVDVTTSLGPTSTTLALAREVKLYTGGVAGGSPSKGRLQVKFDDGAGNIGWTELPVGSDGQVPEADSSQSAGIKWATVRHEESISLLAPGVTVAF